MKYNDLINELMDLLDKDEDIIKVKELKKELLNDSPFLCALKNYKLEKNINNKKILFDNPKYLEYLNSTNNINMLILEIKKKFNFVKKGCLK